MIGRPAVRKIGPCIYSIFCSHMANICTILSYLYACTELQIVFAHILQEKGDNNNMAFAKVIKLRHRNKESIWHDPYLFLISYSYRLSVIACVVSGIEIE